MKASKEFENVTGKCKSKPHEAATWMDLQIVTLSEVSQTQNDKYHIISLICGILKKKEYK